MKKPLVAVIIMLLLMLPAGCGQNTNPPLPDVPPSVDLFENEAVLTAKLSLLDSLGDGAEICWDGGQVIDDMECYTYSTYVLMEQDDGRQVHRELRLVGMWAIAKQDGSIFTSIEGENWEPWTPTP